VLTPAYLTVNEAGRLEHAHVPGNGRERDRQRRGQIGDPRRAIPQRDQQAAPGWIGQRRVGPVQRLIFNHRVDVPVLG